MWKRRWQHVLFFLRVQWPLILASLAVAFAFWLAFQFVQPAPPRHVVMAAGFEDGGYDYFARIYAEILARDGITVEIRHTRGSLENIRLLNDPESGVDVGLAQGGVGWMAGVYLNSPEESLVRSLAEIYYEPLWVFSRRGEGFGALRDLRGKKLGVGQPGSGTHALSVDLLKWSGVDAVNSVFVELDEAGTVAALREGRIDAAFFVGGTGSATMCQLVADDTLELHSFDDAKAYARRFGYLSVVTLPRGVLDLAAGVPRQDMTMLAPTTVLETREDLHPALAYLLLEAAREIHSGHGILSDKNEFPNIRNVEFPPHSEAERYFQSGAPLLQRFLPYHLAVFLDRTKVLLLPLLTLLFPLVKIAYPTYRWSVRRSIWKWYKAVSAIESEYYRGGASSEDLLKRIHELEVRVAQVHVPFAYASELYTLRHHLVMVRKLVINDEAGKNRKGEQK